LVLTANACPCGQTGKERGVCFCSAPEIRRYWDRIGTPLLDRVDLRVFVTPESPDRLLLEEPASPEPIVMRIARAREIQRIRGQGPLLANASLGLQDLEKYCRLDRAGLHFLAKQANRNDWSSRAIHSLMRVSRTIADLEASETVSEVHLEEASSLRKPQGEQYWES
jgi:magnesium chelatase family protein